MGRLNLSDQPMTSTPLIFDQALLQIRRNRVASRLDDHDFLLARVAEDICSRLNVIHRKFPVALDLGCHHGLLTNALRAHANIGSMIAADASPAMLERCRGLRVQAAPDGLPFCHAAFDLVVSGLTLHLVNDLPGALLQIRQSLKPDGLLLAALLGGATLTELRQVFAEAETEVSGGASPRVAPFADVRDLGSLMQRAGFALPVVDADTVTVSYPSALHLMRDLRAMGASNVLIERRKVPLARAVLMRTVELYAERFSRPDGRVTATFEIITLTGWAPHDSQQKPLRPGSATARLADALGAVELPTGDKPNL